MENLKKIINHLKSIIMPFKVNPVSKKEINRNENELRYHLGCGEVYLPGYINVDYPLSAHTVMSPKVDLRADITKIEFKNDSVDEIRLHHVFEHFSYAMALHLLSIWNCALKIGGTLKIETPDFELCSKKILSKDYPFAVKMRILRHIFGSHEAIWAYHMDGWYEEKFRRILSEIGFSVKGIERTEYQSISNIIITAVKEKTYSLDDSLSIIKRLLKNYLVNAESESEKKLFDVWMKEIEK